MKNLTENEIKVLNAFGSEEPVDEFNTGWILETYSKLDTKVCRAIFASLIKKEILEVAVGEDDHGKYKCFRIIDSGILEAVINKTL